MPPTSSNEGTPSPQTNERKPLHFHSGAGGDDVSVQSALRPPSPTRDSSSSGSNLDPSAHNIYSGSSNNNNINSNSSSNNVRSGGINLQNYSRTPIMFTPNDPLGNAGTLIDPSPLIARHLEEQQHHQNQQQQQQQQHGQNNGNGNGQDDNLHDNTNNIGHDDTTSENGHENFEENNYNNNNQNNEASSWSQTYQTIRHPLTSTKTYFTNLSSIFTWKFLAYLGVVMFCTLGGAFTLVMSLGLPLFKELGIDASRQQLYMTMIMSPWAMKPFIGVASDLFPIGGYNKKYFCIYSILIGLFGCTSLLLIYHSDTASNAIASGSNAVYHLADLLVLCFTAISFEGASVDILCEGKYSEFMRLKPESGSDIISYKFGMSLMGGIVTQIYVGPLSDRGYFHILFWIALGLSLTPLLPTLMGWLPEKKRTAQEPGMKKLCPGILFDQGMFLQRKIPFIVITLSGLAGPLMAAVTTFADLEIGLFFAGLLLVVLAGITYMVFPRVVFFVILAMILMNVSRPQLNGALGYFYTADEECLADGPHFNYTYYITITGIVGSVVNFVSVILYQSFLSSWRFRPCLIFTTVIGSLAPIIDVIIIMRWNEAIGISDEVFFLLGNAIFENLVVILLAIPMSSIYAKVAPPGMESAVFAYVVGIGNFTGMFSGLLGSGIIQWSNMKTVGENCDFSELPAIIVLYKILLPMLVGIPATFLIPNVFQTEPLIDWDKEKWCEGDVPAESEGDPGSLIASNHEEHDTEGDGRIEPHLL